MKKRQLPSPASLREKIQIMFNLPGNSGDASLESIATSLPICGTEILALFHCRCCFLSFWPCRALCAVWSFLHWVCSAAPSVTQAVETTPTLSGTTAWSELYPWPWISVQHLKMIQLISTECVRSVLAVQQCGQFLHSYSGSCSSLHTCSQSNNS